MKISYMFELNSS